jgi:hypothetical protein
MITCQRTRARASGNRSADALQAARHHQKRHAGSHTAQDRGEREDNDSGDDETLAPEIVTQPAKHRNRHHRRQQVGARDPCVVLETAQFGNDRWQGGADHGLIERHQHVDKGDAKHRQQRITER